MVGLTSHLTTVDHRGARITGFISQESDFEKLFYCISFHSIFVLYHHVSPSPGPLKITPS